MIGKKILLSLALAALAGLSFGCGSKQTASTPAAASSGMRDDSAIRELTEPERVTIAEKVYFEFDRAEIKPEGREILTRKAPIIKNRPKIKVLVEGHCDERGTPEYNMALGDRRAKAAQKFLVNLGVSASQLETISYGEERPAVMGHNESAWSQNRRAEFKAVY